MVYEARKFGVHTLNVLRISNVLPGYPLSAYPNTWDEMTEYDQIPEEKELKKRYRQSHAPGELYRDLSTVNGSTRRTTGHDI